MKKSKEQIMTSDEQKAKKMTFQTAYELHRSLDSLEAIDRELIETATQALEDSYSPYSNFKVGAALLLDNGQIIKGSNQENASYPLCLCAERVAFAAAAVQFPKNKVITLAVTAKSASRIMDEPISPCGACRQVIREVELKHDQDMRIILRGETGDIYIFENGSALLPFSFDPSVL